MQCTPAVLSIFSEQLQSIALQVPAVRQTLWWSYQLEWEKVRGIEGSADEESEPWPLGA